MIKYIIVAIALIYTVELYSQKNILIEYKYLQLVNAQGDKELAADNYRNAEIICDSIIFNNYDSSTNSYMFFELANSYNLNNDYAMMAFSLLRQRHLSPNDLLITEGSRLFHEAALRLQITHNEAVYLYDLVNPKSIKNGNYADKMIGLYQSSIFLFDDSVDDKLMKYYSYYKTQNLDIPYLHQQWQFLTMVDLGMKKKRDVLSTANTNNKELWKVKDIKLQKRVLMRAEHYYRKTGANLEAMYFLEEYEKLDLNLFNKIQRVWRVMLN